MTWMLSGQMEQYRGKNPSIPRKTVGLINNSRVQDGKRKEQDHKKRFNTSTMQSSMKEMMVEYMEP